MASALVSSCKVTVAVSNLAGVAKTEMTFIIQRDTIHEDLLLSTTKGPMKVLIINP